MRFDTSQQMRTTQQMKLAPRMIQSMEILQMPLLALQERIDQELESNVALELVDPGVETDGGEADGGEADGVEADGVETDGVETDGEERQREESIEERELVVGEDSTSGADDWERLSALESNYREAFDNEYSSQRSSPRRASGERDKKMDAMANIAARGESLIEQLLHEWSFAEVDPEIATVGQRLIAYIDDDGLLSADLETILDQNQNVPGVTMSTELLERALRAVQHWLEPVGIGARTNRECLLLQVERRERDADNGFGWPDVRRLIEEHFDDLLQNRLPKIAQKTEMSIERIQRAMGLMRKLNLSPGRTLVDRDVPPIIPDVIVEYDEQADAYVAAHCDGRLPSLRLSRRYEKMARDRSVDKATREFVSNSVRNATWLIESIGQRKNTLLRVVNVVLARQREYFDQGPQYLKPLPMIDVADQLGIHVGTVSRAVSHKWMQTPRGLVRLRKFFSGGTETDSGRNLSWEAVKATLKEIIDAEDKSRPLSDEALAAELKRGGIDIARRTVVKYRQQLDIPPARRRKVWEEGTKGLRDEGTEGQEATE